jgi:hypothetical protein
MLAGAGGAGAQLSSFSIPGDIGWSQAQQAPLNPVNFYQTVDYTLAADGIAPADTCQKVAVPVLPDSALTLGQLSSDAQVAVRAFARFVTRDSVYARQDVVVAGSTVVRQGQLLIPAMSDFPRDPVRIRQLRLAGIDTLRAAVNLLNAVLWPRDTQKRFLTVLTTPTVFERVLTEVQQRTLLERMIDADPTTALVRVDQINRPVEKKPVIYMDLISRFPVGLVRFYCRPQDNPLPIASFRLEVNDGIAVLRGQASSAAQFRIATWWEQLGATLPSGGAGLPVYTQLLLQQSNTDDTVSVRLNPPQYLQRLRFRSLTGLDYDVAELEAYSQGYVPLAIYMSKPLPLDVRALPTMQAYLGGDRSKRAELDRLQGGTLGRVFWDEEKIGEPASSSAVVNIQTGLTPEPLLYRRLSTNGDIVEWRPNAQVLDHRAGSVTFGQRVDLDNPLMRASARAIWNALADQERVAALTTFPEYTDPAVLSASAKLDKRSNDILPQGDALFWSGFQPLRNGQLIPVPGERPFFQLRVDFTSRHPSAATAIRNLRFEQVFPPLLPQVRAEVVPAAEVTAGVDTVFTLALRPLFQGKGAGFNRVRVTTPTAIDRVEKVEFASRDTSGQLVRPQNVEFLKEMEPVVTDSFFVLGIPRVAAAQARRDSLVVLIRFVGRVLDVKTNFATFVFLDSLGTAATRAEYADVVRLMRDNPTTGGVDTLAQILPQRAQEGDVLSFTEDLSDRNSLNVVTSVAQAIGEVVARVQLGPNPFTPNGDGINETVGITYDVLRVIEPVPVTLAIYDLSGRVVRTWTTTRKVGSFAERWDGRDAGGALLPPGMYVARLSADTDAKDFAATRVVALVY